MAPAVKDVVMMWDDAIPHYSYCPNACHPMKPLRLQLLHGLLEELDVLKFLRIVKPPPIERAQLEAYHASEYLDFLLRESNAFSVNRKGGRSEVTVESGGTRLEVHETLQYNALNAPAQKTSEESEQRETDSVNFWREAIRYVRSESMLDEEANTPNENESTGDLKGTPRPSPSKSIRTPKKPVNDAARTKESTPKALSVDDEPQEGELSTNKGQIDLTSCFQLSSDCPAFDGLYDYSANIAAGSVAGAVLLNASAASIVINWAGGLHHAHRYEAAGFCYVNDIVLAILELLKVFERVLYIDIDVHHGDGVEEAFIASDRVMTVSFHRHGRDGFFPGTGAREDIGIGAGEGFALNVPLYDGVGDDQFYSLLFKPIIHEALQRFSPSAIVMQCGADSISGDRIGKFNLSSAGHARCVAMVKQWNVPTLFLGGGGYTMTNVARTWALETAMLCGAPGVHELSIIPSHDFDVYYSSVPRERVLGVQSDVTMVNENTSSYVDQIRALSIEQIRGLPTRRSERESMYEKSEEVR